MASHIKINKKHIYLLLCFVIIVIVIYFLRKGSNGFTAYTSTHKLQPKYNIIHHEHVDKQDTVIKSKIGSDLLPPASALWLQKKVEFQRPKTELEKSSVSPEAVYDVSDTGGLGRRFDGIGAISGGGATSKLLVNYPAKQRDEILDYLFKPNFGASLHILKVEIGGDGQSTDGTEASHMHTQADENYDRGYEWWLMKEAKKRNPWILLYGLPWTFPGWLGKTPYVNANLTADYVIRWIKGAKAVHNLTIDYIGIWNERHYNITYVETLRAMMDESGLKHVKIVAADVKWWVAQDILKDEKFASAISIVGCHYPGTNSSQKAVATNKPLWSSEDYSTYNDDVGMGCWARGYSGATNKPLWLSEDYSTYKTMLAWNAGLGTIAWNLIASYYQQLPYSRDGLMTADMPWSGYYTVNNPIWVTAHTTQFAWPGWYYLRHSSGSGHLKKGGSYVTLVNNATKDLTIVVETMKWSQSLCIRPFLPFFDVFSQKAVFKLSGSYAKVTHLNVWFSKIKPWIGDIIFQKLEPIKVINGQGTLAVFPQPNELYHWQYAEFSEPYNLAPQMGSFETVTNLTTRRKVVRQTAQQPPISWCEADTYDRTYAVIGDHDWKDVTLSIDVNLNIGGPGAVVAKGAFVGLRATEGGCSAMKTQGLFFFVFPATGTYIFSADLLQKKVITKGSAQFGRDWNRIEISASEKTVEGRVNNRRMFSVPSPFLPDSGFAAIGTHSYGLADFANMTITHTNSTSRNLRYQRMYG